MPERKLPDSYKGELLITDNLHTRLVTKQEQEIKEQVKELEGDIKRLQNKYDKLKIELWHIRHPYFNNE